jgi:hypothetical protein
MRRPRWRKMTWALIIWCVVIAIWIAAGASGTHCKGTYGSACDAGKGIGIAIIFVFGFLGFIVLSLIWFMTRPKTRDCPACGNAVKRGMTVCPSAGTTSRPRHARPQTAST